MTILADWFDKVKYSSTNFLNRDKDIKSNGIVSSLDLQVTKSTGMDVIVSPGTAYVDGYRISSDANITLTVEAASTSNRTDIVVVGPDLVGKTGIIKLIKGTAGAGIPGTPSGWYKLAEVSILANATSINTVTNTSSTTILNGDKVSVNGVNQDTTSTNYTSGTLVSMLSVIAKIIKGIKGTNNWYDAAPKTLSDLNNHIGSTGTSHGVATTSANGFLSSTDKTKLDNIAENANNYSHPSSGVVAGTYNEVTVNAQGHVTSATNKAIPKITISNAEPVLANMAEGEIYLKY